MSISTRTFALPPLLCLVAAFFSPAVMARADEDSGLPTLKFFFFDGAPVEWVVSSDKDAFTEHLAANPDSARLATSIHRAVYGEENTEAARAQMAEWIEAQRRQFQNRAASPTSFQRAEGIVAYLRAHDLSIRKLVEALKTRSGASAVELVAIHQARAPQGQTFKMKVVLVDPVVEMNRMGFNVDLQSPAAGYVPVIYALGTALYDVEEMISTNSPAEELPEPEGERVVTRRPVTEVEEAIQAFE